MRPREQYDEVDRLIRWGYNDCQVARLTGIPRRTVLDWRHQGAPGRAWRVVSISPCGPPDGGAACPEVSRMAGLPDTYAYLLGLYLGDGCISQSKLGCRLRIVCDDRYPGIIQAAGTSMAAVRGPSPLKVGQPLGRTSWESSARHSTTTRWPGGGADGTRSRWRGEWQWRGSTVWSARRDDAPPARHENRSPGRGVGIGIRNRLKTDRAQALAGSNPAPGTTADAPPSALRACTLPSPVPTLQARRGARGGQTAGATLLVQRGDGGIPTSKGVALLRIEGLICGR